MGFLNQRKSDPVRKQAHLNWMGGPAYQAAAIA